MEVAHEADHDEESRQGDSNDEVRCTGPKISRVDGPSRAGSGAAAGAAKTTESNVSSAKDKYGRENESKPTWSLAIKRRRA